MRDPFLMKKKLYTFSATSRNEWLAAAFIWNLDLVFSLAALKQTVEHTNLHHGACESTASRMQPLSFLVPVLRTTWIMKNLTTTGSDKVAHISPASFNPMGMKTFCFLWEGDPKDQKEG